MKKLYRAIVAALLAAVMAFGCVSAFAAEPADEISWNYYGWEESYDYAGMLTVGNNSLSTPEGSCYSYCIFDAPESGLYSIGFTDYAFEGWIGTPEAFENGVAYNEADSLFYEAENDFYRSVFELKKGKNIIGIDCNSTIIDENLSIVYVGEKIESVTISDPLLCNYEFYGCDGFGEVYADAVMTFSSGNSITVNYLSGSLTSEIKSGKNQLKTSFFGNELSIDIDVYFITDVIKSVEICNVEEYLNATVYYDRIEAYIPIEETIIFTFSDGTEKSVTFNSEQDNFITLPNGTEIFYYLETSAENGEAFLNVMFTSTVLRSYECTEENATVNDNIANLASNTQKLFNNSFRYLKKSIIAVLECDDIGDFMDYGAADANYYIRYSLSMFLDIFEGIFSFISFLL